MGIISKWFGAASLESVDEQIKEEIRLLEALLTELEHIEDIVGNKWDRRPKLERILKVEKKSIKPGFAIEKKIEKALEPYLEGETKTANISLVLILDAMLRDFRNDKLWKQLLDLWRQEYRMVKTDPYLLKEGNKEKLKQCFLEQRRIARLLRKISEFEMNETHMHFGMSVSADHHWEYLSLLWERALKQSIPDEHNIIKVYERYVGEKRITEEDFEKIKTIMDKYFAKKISGTKAFIEFNKLLLMVEEEHGTYKGFVRKAEIINAIEEAANSDESLRRKYWLTALDSIAKHNLEHNITHVEIRFVTTWQGLEFWASVAKEIEEKYNRKISIRFIEFIRKNMEEFFEIYKAAPPEVQKYLVAVDPLGQSPEKLIEIANKSPLPLCVHAGEFFSQKDFPERTKFQNVEYALNQVKACVESPQIKRIGHANILGLNIPSYLEGSDKAEIGRLVALQQQLIRQINEKGIVIEVNPTSNIKIRGIKYEEHPVQLFSEEEIRYAISTDDRITFDTNLKKEFYRLSQAMRWKEEELEFAAQMQRAAILK